MFPFRVCKCRHHYQCTCPTAMRKLGLRASDVAHADGSWMQYAEELSLGGLLHNCVLPPSHIHSPFLFQLTEKGQGRNHMPRKKQVPNVKFRKNSLVVDVPYAPQSLGYIPRYIHMLHSIQASSTRRPSLTVEASGIPTRHELGSIQTLRGIGIVVQ